MDADEIQPLSADTIAKLVADSQPGDAAPEGNGKRRAPRWPFPGAIELWVRNPEGEERHILGVCQNLSEGGVGVRLDEPLAVGTVLNLALHQPALSVHGKGTVRHCAPRGEAYFAGLEFVL